ncbi:MAG: 5-(carboxyamino)imidazole ribonucleotide synthase [Verrucomicrobiota bacterium]
MIQPGATLGILGGGQLGRMSILAGRQLGYRFRVFDPKPGGAASMVADGESNAPYDDEVALLTFTQGLDAITFEFENVRAEPLERLAEKLPVHPRPGVLHICQNRRREKEFLRASGLPCADFRVVESLAQLKAAVGELGTPCVLKTADFGYDGKGQVKITDGANLQAVWSEFNAPVGVVEQWIPFEKECSVVAARTAAGEVRCFPMAENVHLNHILHLSICPARIEKSIQACGEALACEIAQKLDVVGLIAVEFFLTREGELLVNETAPRPHNSGHYTIDACATSQFEQHIRAVCGLPLGEPALHTPAVMINLLGDVWHGQAARDWTSVLQHPRAKLHLYDKGEPRTGRKMGHVTLLAEAGASDAPIAEAEALFKVLSAAP